MRTLSAVALAALLAGAPAAARDSVSEGTFERTLAVSGGAVDLDVNTGAGSIQVRRGDAATVRVIGTVRVRRANRSEADEKVRSLTSNPSIEQKGNWIRIGRAEEERSSWRDNNNISISYDIYVPSETKLRARTGSGGQSIEGIRGPAEISTGSGSLKIRSISDSVRASSGSGSVDIDDVTGEVRCETGSGSITAHRIGRDFRASTGSGTIR